MSTHPCQAFTSTGDPCPNHAHHVMDVLQRTSTVYLSTMLPLRLQGGGWLATHIHVCGTHRTVLLRGKALQTTMRMATPTPQEESNTMNHIPGCNDELCGGQCTIEPVSKKQIKCGNKDCTNNGWHDTVQEVKACYGVTNRSGDYFEKGRNVRKINNPYPKR